MWHYNFDYLSHGMNGYKYIDKYRGKNGKWNYVYEGQRARERGIKRSTIATKENIKNQLRGTPSYWDYLTTRRVPEGYKYNDNKKPARQIKLTKSEIRQKVQREREREIKSGMSSNRQWNRDAISKGSSVEATQKARERGIAESKAASKQWVRNDRREKLKKLPDELSKMKNEVADIAKSMVKDRSNTNSAQKSRIEEISKGVEAARKLQRKQANTISSKIKNDINEVRELQRNKENNVSQKEMLKKYAKESVERQKKAMSDTAKEQEREHSRKTAAIDAQNARQRAIEASQARQRQTAAAKQQEAERKQAGNRSVERAQNAREAAIAKSVQNTKEMNQAKQVANAAKQQEAERKKSGTLSKAYVDQKNRNKEMEVSKKIARFQNLATEAKKYVDNYINTPKDFDVNSKIKRARVLAEFARIADDPDISTKQKEDLAQYYWSMFSVSQENTRQLRDSSREPNKEEADLFYKLTNTGYLYDNDSRKLDALRLDYRILKNDSTAPKDLLDFVKNKIEELEKKELTSKRVDRR